MSSSTLRGDQCNVREVHIADVAEFVNDENGHAVGGNHFYIVAAPASIDKADAGQDELERIDFLLAETIQYKQPSGMDVHEAVVIRYSVASAGEASSNSPSLTRVMYHIAFVKEADGTYTNLCPMGSPGANLFMYLESGVWQRVFSPRYPESINERETAVTRALGLDASRVFPESRATLISDLLTDQPVPCNHQPPPATLPALTQARVNKTERIESVDHLLSDGHFGAAHHFWIPDDLSLSQMGAIPAKHHFMTTEVKKYPAEGDRPEIYRLRLIHYRRIDDGGIPVLNEDVIEFIKTEEGEYKQEGQERERKLFTYLKEGKWYRVHSESYPESEYKRDQAIDIGKRLLLKREEYSFFKFNCEHFVTFCLTGRATSKQIDFGRWTIRSVGGVSLGLLSIGAATVFPPALASAAYYSAGSLSLALGGLELLGLEGTRSKQPQLE